MKSKAIIDAVQGVTKKWAKQRKAEERNRSAVANRRIVMTKRQHVSVRGAAWMVMEKAYLKASANGTLPAHARQVMYAARPDILRYADRELGNKFDTYFTQQLLPDYIAQHRHCKKWNVVFDARGHFVEPHSPISLPLGTLQVRDYLGRVRDHKLPKDRFNLRESSFPTFGPKNRYGAVVFIEKEGFMPLFREVKLAARFDIAIMSTKGMSVTASRELIDLICGPHQIPLLILRDFDKSGFSIAGTLQRDTRRYDFRHRFPVIDLGLRLDDVTAEGLVSEPVYYDSSENAIRANLEKNGATEKEIEFLQDERVELNAFPSDQFVAFIERKLIENGIKKIIPDDDTLAVAYRRMKRQAVLQERLDDLIEELGDEDEIEVPDDLRAKIEECHAKRPELSWDSIVRVIAGPAKPDDEDSL